MIITALNKQKQHLVSIEFDNGETCLLDRDTCAENFLKCGNDIDDDRLSELKFDSDYRRAKSRALWYLDRSDHTEKALYQKLLRGGFEKRASAAVLARLVELGVIDDVRFAENYAARCSDTNVSSRETVRKMLEKGVPYDIAKAAVAELDNDEEEQIKAVIEKKYLRKLENENGIQKVYAALIRKGFSFGAVRNVLKKYSEELEFSEE